MEAKLVCAFCKEKLTNMEFDASRCEYCKKVFCNDHIEWENHKCKSVPKSIEKRIPTVWWFLVITCLIPFGFIIGYLQFRKNKAAMKNFKQFLIVYLIINLLYAYIILA